MIKWVERKQQLTDKLWNEHVVNNNAFKSFGQTCKWRVLQCLFKQGNHVNVSFINHSYRPYSKTNPTRLISTNHIKDIGEIKKYHISSDAVWLIKQQEASVSHLYWLCIKVIRRLLISQAMTPSPLVSERQFVQKCADALVYYSLTLRHRCNFRILGWKLILL